MTISIKCFERKMEGEEGIGAYWNTDGSMRIFHRINKKDEGGSIKITPAIVRTIILSAELADRSKYGAFFDSDLIILPDMFGGQFARIMAEWTGERIVIKSNSFHQAWQRRPDFRTQVKLRESHPVSISLDDLKAVLNGGIDAKDKFDKEIGIRPVFGNILRKDPTAKV